MAAPTYRGGSTIVRFGGRWPRSQEHVAVKPAPRFSDDALGPDDIFRSAPAKAPVVVRKPVVLRDPTISYLISIASALTAGRPSPAIPKWLSLDLRTAIRSAGGPEPWARRQRAFPALLATAERKASRKTGKRKRSETAKPSGHRR